MHILKFVLFISFLGIAFSQTMSDYLSSYTYSSDSDIDAVKIYWKISSEVDGLDIAVWGSTTGWVGIGFTNYTDEMDDNEAVIGWYDSDDDSVSVAAYTMTGHSVSEDTETLIITNISAVEVDDETAIFFTRTYSTGKYPIDSTGVTATTIIVAYGSDGADSLVKHTAHSNAYVEIYFLNGTSSASSSTTSSSTTSSSSSTSSSTTSSTTSSSSDYDDLSDYLYSVDTGLSDLTLYFTAYTTYVDIALRMTTAGYVAIGFTDGDYGMVDSEAVIGWVDDGNASVSAYWLGGKKESEITDSDDLVIYDYEATEIDGETTIYFSRLYTTGVYPIENYTAYLIFAYHSTADSLTEHTAESASLVTVDFSSGLSTEDETTLFSKESLHAVLMFLAFGVLFPFGAFFARYGRDIRPKGIWFTVHKYTQITAGCIALAGFIVALVMVDGNHFDTLFHSQLGFALVMLTIVQALWALARPHNPEPGESKSTIRNIWEVFHYTFALIILLSAIVVIFAGIDEYGNDLNDAATTHVLTTAYAVFVSLVVLVFVVVETRKCLKTASEGRIKDNDLQYQLLPEGYSRV